MRQLAFRSHRFPVAPEGDLDVNNGSPGSAAAVWLRAAVEAAGLPCGAPGQEDYGWGFWLSDPCMVWVAVGLADDDAAEATPEWVVSVSHERPLFAPSQWFKGAQGRALEETVLSILARAIAADPEMTQAP